MSTAATAATLVFTLLDPGQDSRGKEPTITIVAGNAEIGDGLPAIGAYIGGIGSIALDASSNVYFTDIATNLIRRVDSESGIISTIVGSGPADVTRIPDHAFLSPSAIAVDDGTRAIVTAEVVGKRVRRIDLRTLKVTDLGAPPGGFGQPVGVLCRAGIIYVVDTLHSQVWRYDGTAWTGLFRDRPGSTGGLRHVVADASGNLYVSEFFGHRIWRWNAESGTVSVVAGDGRPGRASDSAGTIAASLHTPDGVAIGGRHLYFAEMMNARVGRIDLDNGRIEVYRDGSSGPEPLRWSPGSIAVDAGGTLYVADVRGNRILRFSKDVTTPTVIAGGGGDGDGGRATEAHLAHPGRLAVDEAGNVFISDAMHHRIRKVERSSGIISTIAGTGRPGYNGDAIPAHTADLSYPGGLLLDNSGHLFVGDYYNNRVRMIDLPTGIIHTIAGTGDAGETGDGGHARAAKLLNPQALALDANGDLLVTSAVSPSVRRINLKSGIIQSVRLDPAVVPDHRTIIYYGISRFRAGFYLADGMRGAILFHAGDRTSTVVPAGGLTYPMDVAVDPGGTLYICDTRRNQILRWTGRTLEVVVSDLARPRGIAFDREGTLYVADTFNNRVVRVKLPDDSHR
jgi:sugar lactone lactonase YvrE